jgi:hypothetical protein
MFDYNQRIQSQQHQEEIARKAHASEPEGWTHPVPNLIDKLFAALKPSKPAEKPARRSTAAATKPAK